MLQANGALRTTEDDTPHQQYYSGYEQHRSAIPLQPELQWDSAPMMPFASRSAVRSLARKGQQRFVPKANGERSEN